MWQTVKGIIGGDEFLTEVLIRGLTLNGAAETYYVGNFPDSIGNQLAHKYGVNFVKNMNDFVSSSILLFLAFEPYETEKMLKYLSAKINPEALIVSVVPDLKIETLEATFPNNEIIRLFITPSIISGQGLGAYVMSKNASISAKSVAQIIMNDCGDVVNVENEHELEELADYLTANTYISYVTIQNMVKRAKQIGMTPHDASFVVGKLFKGAIFTLLDNGKDTSAMIRRGTIDKKFRTKVTKLIETQGIKDDLKKFIDTPVYAKIIEEEEADKFAKGSSGESSSVGADNISADVNRKVTIRDKSKAGLDFKTSKIQMHYKGE